MYVYDFGGRRARYPTTADPFSRWEHCITRRESQPSHGRRRGTRRRPCGRRPSRATPRRTRDRATTPRARTWRRSPCPREGRAHPRTLRWDAAARAASVSARFPGTGSGRFFLSCGRRGAARLGPLERNDAADGRDPREAVSRIPWPVSHKRSRCPISVPLFEHGCGTRTRVLKTG